MVHLSWISTGMIVLGVCTLIITLLYVRNDIATREYQRLESLRGSRWPVGESPVDLFDSRDWLACLNATMICVAGLGDRKLSHEALSDDGPLRELTLLAAGLRPKWTLEALREAVLNLERQYAIKAAIMSGVMP